MAPKRAQMNVRLDPTVITDADLDRSTIGEKGISRDAYVADALTFYRTHRTNPPATEPDPAAALAEAAQLAARISGDALSGDWRTLTADHTAPGGTRWVANG